MKSPEALRRDAVNLLLVVGWGCATLIAIGTYLIAGFYGWLAIFAWSVAAAPLALLTARHLAAQRRPLDAHCRLLALQWWGIVALATLTSGIASTLLDLRQLPFLAGLTVIGMWLAFLGQLMYVFSATSWMMNAIFALGQS